MPRFTSTRLLVAALAVGLAGCDVAYRTDMMRKDVLTDAQQVIADARITRGDLAIEGTVDRADAAYAPGQPITLSVKTSKDAHVAILRVLENGDTTIIFPNRAHKDSTVKANTVLTVPGNGGAVTTAVDKPGTVLFMFIASGVGTSWLFNRAPDNGSDFADLGVTTREIAKDIVSTLKVGGAAPTAASHLTVRVTGRGML